MVYLGAKRFAKKDGSGFCHMIQYAGGFSDKEIQAGSIGLKVLESFIPESVFYQLVARGSEVIYKEIVFDFVMNSGGKPDICGVRFVEK